MNYQSSNRPRPSQPRSYQRRPDPTRPDAPRSGQQRPYQPRSYQPRPDTSRSYQSRPYQTQTGNPRAYESARTARRTPPRRARGRRRGGPFAAIRRVFSNFNRRLDVFRRNEVSAVVVNSLLAAVVLVIVLSIAVLVAPGARMAWARILTSSGRVDRAEAIVDALEEDGFSSNSIIKARGALADRFISLGRFEDAQEQASAMPEGSEAQELIQRSNYGQACALYDSGEYRDAAQQFYQLNDYGDSASRYADCRCALAVETYLRGDEEAARQMLINVENVDSHIQTAALKVTGSESEAASLLALDLFNPQSLAQMEASVARLLAARADMPSGRIAAGYAHTVGLRSDGAVLATGDNSRGQCDVSGWSGIAQVAAGAYHTVGLKSDGTVVATGDDEQGQCDVSGWSDITAVAATAYGTLGLKRDGTVVACGMDSDAVSGWRDVTRITGGSYAAACLYGQGDMMSTHEGAQLEMSAPLCDLSVCGPVAAGLLLDGSLISNYEGAPQWSGLASITATETGLLCITGDGQAVRYTYRTAQSEVLNVEGKAVEAESGGTHWVVLTDGGRVFAFGENGSGQCDVSGWQL